MAIKIRLQRHGRKSYAFYSIVIADVRAPRDGKFIEKIGTYNPNTNPATVDLKFDRALDWVLKGAQPAAQFMYPLLLKAIACRSTQAGKCSWCVIPWLKLMLSSALRTTTKRFAALCLRKTKLRKLKQKHVWKLKRR